ncbi:MAG TPA: universal stress protein [Nitrososphaera sp.]|jgi:nucleotide-binding universal stress UspA family protein
MKATYKKILVPHDGSGASDRALERAVPIANAAGAKIMLLHVIPVIVIPPVMTDYGYSKTTGEKLTAATLEKELYYEMKKDAANMLDQRKKKYARQKATIEPKLAVGYAPDKITEFIREQNIDLVVMGTTSLQGIAKIATIGSVARKVSEESPCPVILVH